MVTLVGLWKMVCLEENDMRIRNRTAIFFLFSVLQVAASILILRNLEKTTVAAFRIIDHGHICLFYRFHRVGLIAMSKATCVEP